MSSISQEMAADTKKLYRARIIPLFEGHRQEDKAFWDYTHAPSVNQASYFLMIRYPYPKFFVETPVLDVRGEVTIVPEVTLPEGIKKDGLNYVVKDKKSLTQLTEIEDGATVKVGNYWIKVKFSEGAKHYENASLLSTVEDFTTGKVQDVYVRSVFIDKFLSQVKEIKPEVVVKPPAVEVAKLPALQPTGTCYVDAGRYQLGHPDTILVHGSIVVISEGEMKRILHAWVELPDGGIWSNELTVTKEQWTIAQAEEHARYDLTQSTIQMLKHKHWGPWKEAVAPAHQVRRTNPSLDAMVKHLGYEPVDDKSITKTDIAIVKESQERLKLVEVIPDRSLSPSARTSLSLAKRIASDVASRRRVRGVRAASIPPASDRVRTAGMYARGSEEIYISTDMLERGKTAVDSTLHEMAHHNSGAEDGNIAHSTELARIGGLVVENVASKKYDDIIGRPEFTW